MKARHQSPKEKVKIRGNSWITKFWEDMLQPDGTYKRSHRTITLGKTKEICETVALQRAEIHFARVNVAVPVQPKAKKTLAQFVPEWREAVKPPRRKPSAVRAMESHLRTHIIPKLGHLALTELTTKVVQDFVNGLPGGLARKTIENILMTLSSITSRAKKWKYPCGDWSYRDLDVSEEGVKKDVCCFTDDDVRKLIAEAKDPFATILALTATLGLRIGEALGLRVEDLDFDNKIVRIRQAVDSGTRTVQSLKSECSEADLPMPPQLEERLQNYLKSRPIQSELLFVSRTGRPFSANKLREKKLRPLLERLGIKRGGFHAARHGTATSLLANGANLAVVQKQLRHSDVRTTMRYAHPIDDDHRKAVESRAKLLAS